MYARTFSSTGGAADHDLDLVAEAGGRDAVDGTLHGVEGQREQPAQRHDVGVVLLDGGDEVLDRHVRAEVVDGVAVDPEHEHDDVLADVVDVAADRADDDRAPRASASGAPPSGSTSCEMALHDLAAHDELGDERLAVGVAAADHLHRLAALRDDGQRVRPVGHHALGERHRLVHAQAHDRVRQLLRHTSPSIRSALARAL